MDLSHFKPPALNLVRILIIFRILFHFVLATFTLLFLRFYLISFIFGSHSRKQSLWSSSHVSHVIISLSESATTLPFKWSNCYVSVHDKIRKMKTTEANPMAFCVVLCCIKSNYFPIFITIDSISFSIHFFGSLCMQRWCWWLHYKTTGSNSNTRPKEQCSSMKGKSLLCKINGF